MTKRILSFILAVLTLFALWAPAFASAEPEAALTEDALEPDTVDIPDAGAPSEEPAEQPGAEEPSGEPEATPGPEVTLEPEPADLPSEEPSDEPEVVVSSGWCGDNVRWYLSGSSLTIAGTGAMYDYTGRDTPWEDYQDNIVRITVQDGITGIGDEAFSSCMNVTSVSLPNSLISVGDRSFSFCSNLTSITLPRSLRSIGTGAFSVCNIASVTIPASVTYVGVGAFGSNYIQNIHVASGNKAYTSKNGVLFNKDMSELIEYPVGRDEIYTIPDSVTVIGESAFGGGMPAIYSRLRGVIIPDSVTTIGAAAFHSAVDLTSITLPASVTYIGDFAFCGCWGLTSITVPRSVTYIGDGAFAANLFSKTSITVLNPSCTIVGDHTLGYTESENMATVHGYDGSTAQAYARANGYVFKSLGKAPEIKNGWSQENGKKYYYINNVKQKGMKTIGGEKYYFSVKDGHMLTGLVTVDNKGHMCYFSARDGRRLTGLVNTGGGIRYFSARTGYMLKGLVTVDSKGHQCYFSVKDGHRLTGLVNTGGGIRYFSAKNGYMLKGLVTTDNKGTKRFFSLSTGYMAKNQWVYVNGIRYYANANGVVTKK